jgi:hypothetical protein
MSLPSLQLFETPCTLLDCSLEQRAAAVVAMLEAEATSLGEREELLALICWPTHMCVGADR